MVDIPTQNWTGVSGKQYVYYVYQRHPVIDPDQLGNYIYAKKNQNGAWVPIYIGQGDLSARCTKNHHQIECINAKGATHVHLRLNAVERDRRAEESDLLGHFTNAYAPGGCNVKIGG
jgi:hypothetical protein